MSSTSVTQHTSQPLNFGPEWLRALSTPDSATSNPSSSGSGNVFKFSAIKYRYSKDEILALRVNVAERLAENLQNEIMNNLKDVENVFRADILDPLSLTPPTAEETAKMNALSSYISGRTPGGAGRPGNNSQPSQSDSRMNRAGSSISNGRGSNSRGRGGRDNNNFGSNRGNNNNNNNNSDDNGENGNVADETSASTSSWSRNNHHSRGGGGGSGNAFGNRVRSFDDREQSQTFRRGAGRQTSDGWRRSRGDDDENTNGDQGEDSSTPVNGSSSWTSSRNGPARRVNSNGSMDQRTKSNDKWSHNDERSGSSSSAGWRTNSSTSDRDFNARRLPTTKREQMPEWMDDNIDDDNQLNNATFEQDGTFTSSTSVRPSDNEEKPKTQSTSEESPVDIQQTVQDESKSEQSIPQPESTIPAATEPLVTQSKPIIPSWDDDYDHHDLAKTIVESTLAEDHDYSPPTSTHPTPRHMSIEPSIPIIPPVVIDDKQWFYKDPQNTIQGPFPSTDMERWFNAGYFNVTLPVKRLGETQFSTIQQLIKEMGRLPFRADQNSSALSVQKSPINSNETQKYHSSLNYPSSSSSSSSNAFIDDYLMQQTRQQTYPFARQTSMPIADRKPHSTSQLPNYFSSQPTSNLTNDSSSIYPPIHRSLSSTNNQYDYTRSMTNSNSSSYFQPTQTQQSSNDLLSRLQNAMQTRSKDYEFERMKAYEQTRLQREEEEKRKFQLQQEFAMNRQSNIDQLSKTMDMESLLAFQQAKIEAQQAEAIRRYQQRYGEQPLTNNWNRSNSSFLDNSDQDHRANAFAHQYANTESLTNCSPLSFSLNNKTNTWSRNSYSYDNNSQIQTAKIYNQQATDAVLSMLNTHPKTQTEYIPTWENQSSVERNDESVARNIYTQELLVKWTEYQFKDNLKDIDVSTLIQLLKDIDNPNEIIEYVRPYMGSISKAKEFADSFLFKRDQFSKIESNLNHEHLTDLLMNSDDDGFQIASSHTHRKKSKKLKGQKLDCKQLGFTMNNTSEQRDDIDQILM